MTTRSHIICRFQFEAFHNWPDAPVEHAYLKTVHRHMFHVAAWKRVTHDNRDVEFIKLKRDMASYCLATFGSEATTLSCEMMAKELLEQFDLDSCEVSEDGENGGRVTIMEHFPLPPFQPKDSNPAEEEEGVVAGPTGSRFRGECFMGKECEGPYEWRDQLTLFIPGSYLTGTSLKNNFYRFTERLKRMRKNQSVIPVYLGADNDLNHRESTIEYVLDKLASFSHSGKDTRLFVEVESVTDFLNAFVGLWNRPQYSDLDKYLVSRNPDDITASDCFAIKLFGKQRIIWITTQPEGENEYIFSTMYNDSRFEEDFAI